MSILQHAQSGDEQAFRALTDPFRRELTVHCYRIVGSVQDADDLVQETLLAAWRGLTDFEERASLRTWLYRIATNLSLNALRDGARRPQVTDRAQDRPAPTRMGEPVWLQPYPDAWLEGLPDDAPGPEARYEAREAIGLAFITGLQRLPPLQRAVLVLRDVLGYRATEVAEMLDTTVAAVTSGLQRARTAMDAQPERAVAAVALPGDRGQRALLGRFADAFEAGDVDAIVALLTDDAWLRMPPEPHEYQGRAAIAEFLGTRSIWQPAKGLELIATQANGQPAFGYYVRDPRCGVARAGGLLVLGLDGDRVAAITRFGDTAVLPLFGLPRTIPAG